MPINRLKELLENRHVFYQSITHPQTYTAQRTAQCTHIKGKEMAKTVVVRLDGHPYMVVIPAPHHVNLERLKEVTHAHSAEFVPEQEFPSMFPECEVGAMPPFGNLYGMDVIVERHLAEDDEIAFNAGTHTEIIQMSYKDFEEIVHPRVDDIAS